MKNIEEHYIYLRVKRLLDLFFAFVGLGLFAFPWLIICILIRVDSEGAILFRQVRVGERGKLFICYKFRSMYVYAPKESAAGELVNRKDMTTKVGRILRQTSLDEVPQLINVIKGDMSLIGPRPLIVQETWINQERMCHGVSQLKPGLTGLAQINGRNNLSDREKLNFDIAYLEAFSFKQDALIFFKTVLYVLQRKDILS